MRRHTLRRKGSAAVETAVMMIVLIPLIMYTLFLEDLLFYKLDQEETVMSTPWDMTLADYRHNDNGAILNTHRGYTMQTFWDHTSAWNTYDNPNHDAQDTDHHQALTAHQCWLAQGGKEVTCGWNESFATNVDGRFNQLGKGGRVECSAILGVQNYFIPQQFMQWWAQQALTDQKRWTGNSGDSAIHTNAHSDAYTFPEEFFSVVVDPWALNWIRPRGISGDTTREHMEQLHEPMTHPLDQGSEWTAWMKIPYGMHDNTQKAIDFADEATNKKVLSSAVKQEPMGADLTTPPLAWKKDPAAQIGGFYPSGYKDQRVRDTHTSRYDAYLGQADTAW